MFKNKLALFFCALIPVLFFLKRTQIFTQGIKFSPPKGEKIVLFGDENGLQVDTKNSFQIRNALKKNTLSQDFNAIFINEIRMLQPDAVLIYLGREDLRQGVLLQDTLKNLQTVFETIHKEQIPIVLGVTLFEHVGDNWSMSLEQLCMQRGVLWLPLLKEELPLNPKERDYILSTEQQAQVMSRFQKSFLS